MSKVFIGVFAGVFIGAVIYELLNRTNPALVEMVENMAKNKIDDMCGVNPVAAA